MRTQEELLEALAAVNRARRMALMVEVGRRSAADAAFAAVLSEMATTGEAYERRLPHANSVTPTAHIECWTPSSPSVTATRATGSTPSSRYRCYRGEEKSAMDTY